MNINKTKQNLRLFSSFVDGHTRVVILLLIMQYEEVSWYSERVHRDMRIKIYGHYGTPVLAFPCQDKGCDDFANHGMNDALAPLIEAGRMKLFCVDTNDDVTVSHDN